MAFITDAASDGPAYCRTFNRELAAICARFDGRLVGVGTVPLGDVAAAEIELRTLAEQRSLAGIAIPPMIGSTALDDDPFRTVPRLADELDLCVLVLVHPTQTPRSGLERHYLTNLLGNRFESAVAIGGLQLGGSTRNCPASGSA